MEKLILEVAAIRIRIETEIAGLMINLKRLYQEYITDTTEYECTLRVLLHANQGPGLLQEKVNGNGMHTIFVGYQIDMNTNLTEVTMTAYSHNDLYNNVEQVILGLLSNLCIKENKIMLHCCALHNEREQFFLFTGPSKIGKSTLAKRLNSLNTFTDDLAIIERQAGGFSIFKTPFDRYKEPGMARQREKVSIYGLFNLVQSERTVKTSTSMAEGQAIVLSNIWLLDYSNETYQRLVELSSSTFGSVDCFNLYNDIGSSQEKLIKTIVKA